MKVLVICTTPFFSNGITKVVLNYDYFINKEKICMDYVVNNKEHNSLTSKLKGKVFFLPMRNKNPLLYCWKLYKILKKEKYNIVHVHGNSSTMVLELFAAFLANVHIRIAHSHSTYCTHEAINRIINPLFTKLVTYGIACSKNAGKWLFGEKVPFLILKNGVDIEKFSFNKDIRKEYREKMGWEGQLIIGNVGYLNYPKNQSFLIEIFNEIHKLEKNAMLVLVGDGEDRPALEEKVIKYNLNSYVEFLGQRDDVNKLMQGMDFFVLPSFFEGFPISILEAEISGLKIICSDTITDEVNITGNIIYQSLKLSPKKWAKVIIEEKKYQRIDQSTLMYEKGLSVEQIAKKLEKLYIYLFKRNGV